MINKTSAVAGFLKVAAAVLTVSGLQVAQAGGYHGAMPARGAAPAEHIAEFAVRQCYDVHGHEALKGHK